MSALLTNKTAIIYGGGGAIGGAVARMFARERARVHLAGRTRTKLDAVARDIQSAGGAELGGQSIRTVCRRPDAIPDAAASSHASEVFEGVAKRIGIPVHEMLAEHARTNTLLGRLPRLDEVAEFAAFAASDRAGAMTGAIVNLTCGSMVD